MKVEMSTVGQKGGNGVEDMELRRGPWTLEEDTILARYIACHGEGRWNMLAKCSGLKRTGKSCRLRWLNYLKPDVKRGNFTHEEQLLILELHSKWGNRWSRIAQHLPGRTDNEIKNYWRTRVQKQAKQLKIDANSEAFRDVIRCLWMPGLIAKEENCSPIEVLNSKINFTDPKQQSFHLLTDKESELSVFDERNELGASGYSQKFTSNSCSSSNSSDSMVFKQATEIPKLAVTISTELDEFLCNPILKSYQSSWSSNDLDHSMFAMDLNHPRYNYPMTDCNWFHDDSECSWNMDSIWPQVT